MMHNFMIVISLFVFGFSFGQNRQNRIDIEFKISSERLTKGIGWAYNENTGQWYNNDRCINDQKGCNKFKSLHNFEYIETHKFEHDSLEYYVFVTNKYDGSFDYPSIGRGWKDDTKLMFFIINKSDYVKFENFILEDNIGTLSIESTRHGELSKLSNILGGEFEYSYKNLKSQITKEIIDCGYCFKENFHLEKTRDEKGNILIRYLEPATVVFGETPLKNEYFESDINTFKKLIIKS